MPLPSIVTACGSWEGLEKSISTLPALAVSDDLVNFSAPPGSASIASWDAEPDAGASVAVSVGVSVADSVAAGVDEDLLLLSLPPQPAKASAAMAANTTTHLIAGDTRPQCAGSGQLGRE